MTDETIKRLLADTSRRYYTGNSHDDEVLNQFMQKLHIAIKHAKTPERVAAIKISDLETIH